jgi:hypothetical protein
VEAISDQGLQAPALRPAQASCSEAEAAEGKEGKAEMKYTRDMIKKGLFIQGGAHPADVVMPEPDLYIADKYIGQHDANIASLKAQLNRVGAEIAKLRKLSS